MTRRLLSIVIGGSVLLAAATAAAQVSREELEGIKSEIKALKEAVQSQAEVLKDLLRRLGSLNETPSATGAVVDLAGAPLYGKTDAKVTIVEFSDYQCPFCARYSRETFPEIDREYIRTGRVRYAFRDYPIEASHPQALKAHEAAYCAGEQGKRREMHERLFANQNAMAVAQLGKHAQAIGLDKAAFDKCLGSGAYASKVRNGIKAARELGVRGTPTFFVGLTDPKSDKLKVARLVVGAQPYAAFKTAIEELLATP